MRYYPSEFINVPDWLEVVQSVPTDQELQQAMTIRKSFLFPNDGLPYMGDILRAFRLLKNAKTYIEIGTYDKGNLAFMSTILTPDAHIIDLDIVPNPEWTKKLKDTLQPSQTLTTLVGDSTSLETAQKVRATLGSEMADGIFIDGNHIAEAVMADYSHYSVLIKPGGYIFFHDVYWHGDEQHNGSALAIGQIDRLTPVFVVFTHHPVHRFLPWLSKEIVWGAVGIIKKAVAI